jgi:hypothetical protein
MPASWGSASPASPWVPPEPVGWSDLQAAAKHPMMELSFGKFGTRLWSAIGHRRKVRYLLRTALGCLCLGVLAYGILFMGGFLSRRGTPEAFAASAETPPATITVRGELVCLPHRAGHPQTFECVLGLRSPDGQRYGLKNLDQEAFATGKIMLGQQVHVTGHFMPDLMEPYDTVGTIEVHSMMQANRSNPC